MHGTRTAGAPALEDRAGTYLLLLANDARDTIRVGRHGRLALRPGTYLYVGSALGPGGVRARLSRHLRGAAARHWHIDYLRARTRPAGAWVSHAPGRLEHRWAGLLTGMDDLDTVTGFGSSDCRCASHLFHTDRAPGDVVLPTLPGRPFPAWPGQQASRQGGDRRFDGRAG